MSDVMTSNKLLELFIKKATLIVLNSRVNKEITEGSLLNQAFLLKEREHFDLEYLFLDEYCVLGHVNDNVKQYTIDIFTRNKKTSLLIERWKFKYLEYVIPYFISDNQRGLNANESLRDLNKKLNQLARSVYAISRMLPGYQIRRKELYSTEYQFYQSIKDEPFLIETQSVSISKSSMKNFNVKVEYLSLKQINDYYANQVHRQGSDYSHRHRFFSDSIKKKIPSYEILNYEEEAKLNENHFENNRRLSTEGNQMNIRKNLRIRPYEVDDFSIVDDEEDYAVPPIKNTHHDCSLFKPDDSQAFTHIVYTPTIKSEGDKKPINRRLFIKTSDTTGPYSAKSNDSFELTIETDDLKPDIREITTKLASMKKQFKKEFSAKWNIPALMKLVSNRLENKGRD